MTSLAPRPRGRQKDEALCEKRRDEILDAAAVAFAKYGYADTEMQRIADAVGVSKGALYHYFPGKEAMFFAAADRGMRRLDETTNLAADAVEDPLERMAEAVRAYLTFFRDHPEFVELLIQERAAFPERERPTYFAYLESGTNKKKWAEDLQASIDAGRLRPQPVERIQNAMCDLLYGTMFTSHFARHRRPVAEQTRELIDFAFRGILSDKERRRTSAHAS
jgi:AcrR family transcriptional regulator